MAGYCYDDHCSSTTSTQALNSPRWRRALWVALIFNAGIPAKRASD